MKDGDILATVDLGSNSFRLEMARLDHGQLVRLDYYKEPVRLGAGFDEHKNLTDAAITRSVECLERFAERLSGLKPTAVRAVATQSLRSARNPDAFLVRAEAALGHPIEVISGQEEARLIYLGAANDLPEEPHRRIVVDIGGGSTELIVGLNQQSEQTESLRIGCVSHTLKFFPDGLVTAKSMEKAITAAVARFEEVAEVFGAHQWQSAYGSSGTAEAIAELCTQLGEPPEFITRAGMKKIAEIMIESPPQKWPFENLRAQRMQVLAGGLAVMMGLFIALNVKSMRPCYSALRQGVMVDLLDRLSEHDINTDVRHNSITRLARRWLVDGAQATRVQRTALALYVQLEHRDERMRDSLSWAALTHEVGMTVSHSSYQKHSDYLIRHADIAGFSFTEQALIADLIAMHRGGLKKWQDALNQSALHQAALCLRLAVILCHARTEIEPPAIALHEQAGQINWHIDAAWRTAFPMSAYLLDEEAAAWAKLQT